MRLGPTCIAREAGAVGLCVPGWTEEKEGEKILLSERVGFNIQTKPFAQISTFYIPKRNQLLKIGSYKQTNAML